MSTEMITATHTLVATLDCWGEEDDDSHSHDPECLDYSIECAEPDPDGPEGLCGIPVESEPCDVHHPGAVE